MSRTKLSDLVRHDGEITTIAKLAEQGKITFHESKNFAGRGTTKYFADIKGTKSGWEIGKTAYMSRTGENIKIGS